MKLLKLGDSLPMTLKLHDAKTDKFVRAKIFNQSFVLAGTYGLNHINSGFYGYNLTGVTIGNYHVIYEVFKDSGYTQKDNNYSDAEEFFSVRDLEGSIQASADQVSSKIDDNDGQIAYST